MVCLCTKLFNIFSLDKILYLRGIYAYGTYRGQPPTTNNHSLIEIAHTIGEGGDAAVIVLLASREYIVFGSVCNTNLIGGGFVAAEASEDSF